MFFEELHFSFVPLSCGPCRKGAQIAPLASARIFFARIQTILPRR
jgi:hypothetical protein